MTDVFNLFFYYVTDSFYVIFIFCYYYCYYCSFLFIVGTNFTYTLKYVLENRNGVDHMKLDDSNLELKSKRVYYKLENLFNGDKFLGEPRKC